LILTDVFFYQIPLFETYKISLEMFVFSRYFRSSESVLKIIFS